MLCQQILRCPTIVAKYLPALLMILISRNLNPAMVCHFGAHASITGIACAVIGNNGPIDTNGATKVAHFIQLCDQADLPIIFFQNTTGYMVGTEYNRRG